MCELDGQNKEVSTKTNENEEGMASHIEKSSKATNDKIE